MAGGSGNGVVPAPQRDVCHSAPTTCCQTECEPVEARAKKSPGESEHLDSWGNTLTFRVHDLMKSDESVHHLQANDSPQASGLRTILYLTLPRIKPSTFSPSVAHAAPFGKL